MKLHEVKSEPQNIEYRMSKGGFASLSHFFIKLTEYITSTFDIHYSIDIRHSLFDIRYSLFYSFVLD